MIIAPTGGVSQELYRPFALYFREQGCTVITFDYRGVGQSAPDDLKGYSASMHQWAVQDIDAVILFARKKFPMQEIIYLGHCIGGELVGLARASQYIGRLVLINSALSCRKHWPLKYRFRLITRKTIVKILGRWFGYFPGKKIGYDENLPRNVMLEWAGWCTNANGVFDAFPDNNYRNLRIPLFELSFTDNWNSPRKAVKELHARFAAADITWQHISPADMGLKKIGHSGFFQPEMRDLLWPLVTAWLNEGERKPKEAGKRISH